ncbi:MAG: response regulator [Nitrospiraceae bacterium]|nr:response regulator [Nitrospiraceae bacterium]
MDERILIIDDEPLVLDTIQKALGRQGYTTVAVKDVRSYMNALQTGRFDLAIMDMHLPDTSSSELARMTKDSSPKIKFLFISGALTPPGVKNFIQKPFRIEALRKLVREILDDPERA